jgi:glycosyltransferase involved in cell wall biosynthesis
MGTLVAPARPLQPAPHEEQMLEYLLNDDSTPAMLTTPPTASPEQAVGTVGGGATSVGRTRTRVLFVGTDPALLTPQTELRDKLISLSEVFDEVHIMVVGGYGRSQQKAEKIGDRAWLYIATAPHWWSATKAVQAVAAEQLQFTTGFRPDIVVALDPFIAGYAGQHIAEQYQRPFQLHLLHDYFSDSWRQTEKHASWLLRLAHRVLKQTESVCVTSEVLRDKIRQQFSHLSDPILLPRFYNIKSILELPGRTSVVKPAKLAHFKFVILFVGSLNHESTLYRVIDAARSVLRSPSIGLVVIGDGPMRKDFEKRAEIFGIKNQVVFEKPTVDVVSYMRAADLLICSDTTAESEEVVIKAAAVGLPLLLARTELRDELFVDDMTAYLCQPDDTIEFAQKLSKFLNNNGIRIQFSRDARQTVKDRLHEDPAVFKVAYRDAIESVLIARPR